MDLVLKKNFDALIVVLDAAHLERNLYLLLQVLEHHLPMVAVLNMADEAEKQGILIDTEELSRLTGVPVLLIGVGVGREDTILRGI